jgi:hypothetical protein
MLDFSSISISYISESRHFFSFDYNLFQKHLERPHPVVIGLILGPINDKLFQRFAMTAHANHFVLFTGVVLINPRLELYGDY